MISGSAFAGGTMKEVCRDKRDKSGTVLIDKKTKKLIQECKTIKVRKKLDGKKVPVKK